MYDDDEKVKTLESHVAQLMEHFDTVQIFVTRVEDNCTHSFDTGNGNWHARRGHVATWIDRWKAIDRANAVRRDREND